MIILIWMDLLSLEGQARAELEMERQQVRTPESSSVRVAQYWVHSFFAVMFTGLVLWELVQDKQKSSF